MKTLQFRCKLLSEVILSQKAATEGNQETLDFIPGGVFLGIAAAEYNKFAPHEQALLFHSGKVRFGDAHPAMPGDKVRSLHIPAVLYYPKMQGLASNYISYFHDREKETPGKPLQLKQCRQGFYTFGDDSMTEKALSRSFALKSAYNRDLRRADDSKMYGYESLEKGAEFLFSVECDDEDMADKIQKALVGVKHIGRSRTAQYGLAEIMSCQYNEVTNATTSFKLDSSDCITVYADGRLIFIDATGEPTYTPTAVDLGFSEDDEILWPQCQLRTFHYAPWNGKRQTRDTDRVGFEKGSTFVVRLNSGKLPDTLPTYIGSYRNEGFGKVIYGWKLLQSAGDNGLKNLEVKKALLEHTKTAAISANTPLIAYLKGQKKQSDAASYIYKEVNDFVKHNMKLFPSSKAFASQWGAIRDIAIQYKTYARIVDELFDKKETICRNATPTDSRTTIPNQPAAYLTHGVASDKWKERGRIKELRRFVDEMGSSEYGDLSMKALVNLSSEMAKKMK